MKTFKRVFNPINSMAKGKEDQELNAIILSTLEQYESLPPDKKIKLLKELREGKIGLADIVADYSFYSRDPTEVAKGLLGATLVRYYDSGKVEIGLITEVDAWDTPVKKSQEECYGQNPGGIYLYDSPRGEIFAITSHKEGKMGVVAIRNVKIRDKNISVSKIRKYFGIDKSFDKKYIDTGQLFILRPQFNIEKIGFKIKETPAKDNEKHVARYKLIKK